MNDLRLKTPFNAMVCGSTSSGKTVLLYGLLRYRDYIFTTPPAKVFYFYSEMQDIYKNMEKEKIVDQFIKGLPTFEELKELVEPYKNTGGSVCVFDDSLEDVNEDISRIFTKLSHHMNSSIFFISQSLFFNNKEYRTMSLNAHYLFLMKSIK